MSYRIVVRAAGGQVTVTATGTVPDGEHEITGQDDSEMVGLAVHRRGPDGRFVTGTSHEHTKGD